MTEPQTVVLQVMGQRQATVPLAADGTLTVHEQDQATMRWRQRTVRPDARCPWAHAWYLTAVDGKDYCWQERWDSSD